MSNTNNEVHSIMLAYSERVKCIDMHPREPLFLVSLFSGQVVLWNYETKSIVKTFEISPQVAVRAVAFITKLQAFASASDDLTLRILNYNTMQTIKSFEAHSDYVRSIQTHSQHPYMFTSSDDMTIRLWDWSQDWANKMTFEGHLHYVMALKLHPNDPDIFATASMDSTVKVWSIHSKSPNFSLEGHEEAVTCLDYSRRPDKPYIVSSGDDHTIRVWDFNTKVCIQIIHAHSHNITGVLFHPDLPYIFSCSADETIAVFSTTSWKRENTLNYGLERGWCIHSKPNSGRVIVGFDKGLVVLKSDKDIVVSMDKNGKIIMAQNNEIVRIDLKSINDESTEDNVPLNLPTKELGTVDHYPSKIIHCSNGQFVTIIYKNEYTIYSSLAWRCKSSGTAIGFAWGIGTIFAVLENSTTLKLYTQFKLIKTIILSEPYNTLHSGVLLGISNHSALLFLDWESGVIVRRIEALAKQIHWPLSEQFTAIVSESIIYILKYNKNVVMNTVQNNTKIGPEGIEDAFDFIDEIHNVTEQAIWVKDYLVYITKNQQLVYYVLGEVHTITTVSKSMSLLGFLYKESKCLLMNKDQKVVLFELCLPVMEFQAYLVNKDIEAIMNLIPSIPEKYIYKLAKQLQMHDYPEQALAITPDILHQFELCIQLKKLGQASLILEKHSSTLRWKQLGVLAMQLAEFEVAEKSFRNAQDFDSLFLLFISLSNKDKLIELGELSLQHNEFNIAWTCFHCCCLYERCCQVFLTVSKFAEAAFYARSYCPHKLPDIIRLWKNNLSYLPSISDSIANIELYPNLFPGIDINKPVDNDANIKSFPDVDKSLVDVKCTTNQYNLTEIKNDVISNDTCSDNSQQNASNGIASDEAIKSFHNNSEDTPLLDKNKLVLKSSIVNSITETPAPTNVPYSTPAPDNSGVNVVSPPTMNFESSEPFNKNTLTPGTVIHKPGQSKENSKLNVFEQLDLIWGDEE